MRFGQDAVEKGGFSGTEIAGQHRDGDFVFSGHMCVPLRIERWFQRQGRRALVKLARLARIMSM